MEHEEVKFKQEASNQTLIFTPEHLQHIQSHLGSEVVNVEQLTAHGSQNTHYKIQTADGRKYILRKGTTDRPLNEYLRLKALEPLTEVSPRVYLLDNSHKYLDSVYNVMGYVDGTTHRLGDKITKEILTDAAHALKKIHSVPIDTLKELEEFRMWSEWRGENIISDHNLQSSQTSPHEFYHGYYRDILEKTQHLKPILKSCPLSLVHGDSHMGNMRVTPSGEYRLMDWELTHVGNYVTDLGSLIVESVLRPEQVTDFLEAYGFDTNNPQQMAVLWWWRMFRACSILSYLVKFTPDLTAPAITPWLEKYKGQVDELMRNIPSV